MASTDVARRLRPGWLLRGRRAGSPPAESEPRAAAVPAELSAALAVARWMLIAVSGLAVWLVAYALVFSGIQEHRAQHTLYAEFREKLAGPEGARIGLDQAGQPIPVGEPVAMLNAPAAHISNLVVVEGTGASQLRSRPGHLRYTVLPGQVGTATIFGRSSMFGAPFADIADLRPGDEIWAVTGQYPNHFEFRVTDVRRAGDPLPAPLPSDGSRLTLVTSEANGWRTGWAPSRTVYVDATLVKPKTAQPVGGHLAAVPDEENAMQADTSGALIPTVFWLQGLLVATLGAVWAWRRWGIWQTWIVAVPTILALLWGATSSASLLLPNLV